MTLRISIIPTLCAALVIASSSVAPANQIDRSAKAAEKLAKELAGRTAGPEVSCIPNWRGQSDMTVIDDNTILFEDGAVVYVQKPRSSCDGIADDKYTLVSRQYGTGRLCSGDINQLVDATTGFYGGSCVFGPFVPYRKTGRP